MPKKTKISNKNLVKTQKRSRTKGSLSKKDQENILFQEQERLNKLDLVNAEKEKKIEQMRNLILRGVTNQILLAKTLGVSRQTIASWYDKVILGFASYTDELEKKSEFGKLIHQLDMSFQKIWAEINGSNMSEGQKIAAISTALGPLRMKAELLGFYKAQDPFSGREKTQNIVQINQEVYNYYAGLMGGDEKGITNAFEKGKINKEKIISIEEISGIKPI